MYFNLIIIKKCSIQHLKSDSPSSHGHQAPIINPKNQQHSATKKGSHEWSMVNIHLTLNNAPFLSTSKVSSKDPPPTAALFFWGGLEKIQKQKQTKTHTTQRGEKNKKKNKHLYLPGIFAWNLSISFSSSIWTPGVLCPFGGLLTTLWVAPPRLEPQAATSIQQGLGPWKIGRNLKWKDV